MTERLKDKIRVYKVMRGRDAFKELGKSVQKSARMIERYLKGDCVPSQHTSYQLALACGCSVEEALVLAGVSRKVAKETA